MPKVTLSPVAATDAGIPADAARTYLEFSTTADCRFSIGATYVEADSQPLLAGDQRIFTDTNSKLAFSFSNGKDTVVYYSKI